MQGASWKVASIMQARTDPATQKNPPGGGFLFASR
jgi:hypothetical protein